MRGALALAADAELQSVVYELGPELHGADVLEAELELAFCAPKIRIEPDAHLGDVNFTLAEPDSQQAQVRQCYSHMAHGPRPTTGGQHPRIGWNDFRHSYINKQNRESFG